MTGRWWLGREIVVAGCFIFLFGVTWFRLFEKQVLEHQQYQEASKSQSTSTQFEPAARGRIFLTDRSGELHPVAAARGRVLRARALVGDVRAAVVLVEHAALRALGPAGEIEARDADIFPDRPGLY